MKLLASILVLSAIVAVAQNKSADPGGWTNARWGMTQLQIKESFPEAKEFRATGYDYPLFGLQHFEIGPLKYQITFYFDKKGGGLNSVTLRAENGDAIPGVYADAAKAALLDALRDKYGEPTSTNAEPSSTGVMRNWQWLMPQTGITLSHMETPDRKYRFTILQYSKREKSDQL